ncbi:hypothetical protein BV25DRAFT_1839213 [Artomyces pyxidatus]|uniref:Uncharacterized protein n=1 Tax=Artomyces pyxidatus TaxID=48021 RepID=A0ACB8SY64_9AGAM|nr:hypothetical protein BV25DRAFT_1839213 [Artomyces pyxidatus]
MATERKEHLRPPHVVSQTQDDARQDFDILFGSEYELHLLKDRLADATAQAEAQEKQCQLLETRLTHEQLRANRSDGQVRQLLRGRASTSLLGLGQDPSIRRTRIHFVTEALIAFHFLWRLSRLLGRKLAHATLMVTRLQGGLQDKTAAYDNLRLDNNILRANSDDLRRQLSNAEASKAELSRKLVAVHVQYTKSLRARERAAEAWIAFRQKTSAQHADSTRSLLLMSFVLWRCSRFLMQQLYRNQKSTTKAKAELGVARTKFNNVNARYDSLMTDCDAAYEKIAKLESQIHRQCDDLACFETSFENLQYSHAETLQQHADTNVRLKDALEKHDNLCLAHMSLQSKHVVLENRLALAEARAVDLEDAYDEHVRASGLTIALFARHIEHEREMAEEDKIRGLQPVMILLDDLRQRLEDADKHVDQMRNADHIRRKSGPLGNRRTSLDKQPVVTYVLPSPPISSRLTTRVRPPLGLAEDETAGMLTPTSSVPFVLRDTAALTSIKIPSSKPPSILNPADRVPLFIQ